MYLFEAMALSFRAFDVAASVGDHMGTLINVVTDVEKLEDAERSLRDAREQIELRLTEIAMRKVELSPPPPLIAAMEAA